MTEQRKRKNSDIAIAVALVSGVAAVFLFLFLNGSESYISGQEQESKLTSLECKKSDAEGSFFEVKDAQRSVQEIKIIFRDDKLRDISYVLESTYNSAEAAESTSARLHADYNIYMGENGLNAQSLNPVFLPQKSKAKATLYGSNEKLNTTTAVLFQIPKEEVESVKESGANKLENIYKSKGFICTYRD